MLKTVNKSKPIVVLANDATFTPDWKPFNAYVESRMCLWCKSGSGSIMVNGRSFDVQSFDYFVLPWGHSVRYTPDVRKPFVVAGIHIVPWHDQSIPVDWGKVPHNHKHPLHAVAYRQDRPLERLDGILHFRLHADHPLIHLSEYVVRSFKDSQDRHHMETCTEILVHELQRTAAAQPVFSEPVRQLRRFIERNLSIPISVNDLADEIGRSVSQVNRICRAHLKLSPGRWIVSVKIEHSCQLLRSTRCTVAEAGRSIGYHDQFHFSRLFKKHLGLSPLKYRQRQQLI